jgi:hypothetical protein
MTPEQIAKILAANLPAIVTTIRGFLPHEVNTATTDAELVAGLNTALATELAKGASWLTQHPKS